MQSHEQIRLYKPGRTTREGDSLGRGAGEKKSGRPGQKAKGNGGMESFVLIESEHENGGEKSDRKNRGIE